jgi:hypothetical protein
MASILRKPGYPVNSIQLDRPAPGAHSTGDGLRWRHVAGPHAEDHRFARRRGDAFALAP